LRWANNFRFDTAKVCGVFPATSYGSSELNGLDGEKSGHSSACIDIESEEIALSGR
jgi:hypothetical protein